MDSKKQLIVGLLFLLFNSVWLSSQVGEECVIARTGETGICEFLSNCKSIIVDIRNKQFSIQRCGIVNFKQTVCCPTNRRPFMPSIAAKMCCEYRNAVFQSKSVYTLFNDKRVQKHNQCALKIIPFIVDGTKARSKEFPHMASIGYGESDKNIQHFCGGSLVAPQFIVTAAHCRGAPGLGPAKYVRLGVINLKKSDDDHLQTREIIEIIVHPNYKYPSAYNDIGLMKLDRTIEFNSHIYPICLPTSNDEINIGKALASGFGAVDYAGPESDNLLRADLNIFPFDECSQIYESDVGKKLSHGIEQETQFCAGSRNDRKDTCQGDSGGPLQRFNSDVDCTYTLIGITSFGKGCGEAGIPGVYTRVSYYVEWISGHIWTTE